MRGCLTSLLVLVALIAGAAWFLTPLAVDALVGAALTAGGLHGTDTTVDATADPPPMLLTGHADRIRIRSDDVTLRELKAASLDVTISDVGLLARSFANVDGTLTGVKVVPETGPVLEADSVVIHGGASSARVLLTLDSAQVITLVSSGVAAALGPSPGSIVTSAPNRVTFNFGGRSGSATIVVVNGVLTLRPIGLNVAPIVLLRPASDAIWRLTSATVTNGGLELGLLLDLRQLLH